MRGALDARVNANVSDIPCIHSCRLRDPIRNYTLGCTESIHIAAVRRRSMCMTLAPSYLRDHEVTRQCLSWSLIKTLELVLASAPTAAASGKTANRTSTRATCKESNRPDCQPRFDISGAAKARQDVHSLIMHCNCTVALQELLREIEHLP